MVNPITDARFDHALLESYCFDYPRWQSQVDSVQSGPLTGDESIVRGTVAPLPSIPDLSYDVSGPSKLAFEAGVAALSNGETAVLVLNGGLATRFGGTVKGIVEVFDGKSFLGLKAEDARRAAAFYGRPVPFVLLNSFSTADITKAHFAANGNFGLGTDDVFFMNQTISVRLDLEGEPFWGADGAPRYYAPGHGEFFDVLQTSGVGRTLRDRGVKWLMFSNVDNLGATIDPLIVGSHIVSGAEMTVEVIQKRKNAQGQYDVGGAPVLLNGTPGVVEGFRFPPYFDQETVLDFQTNNMVFTLDAISQPMNLPRYLVNKTVEGRPSLAFEAISCEASNKRRADGSMALKLGLLRVPRDGVRGRFFPVKSRGDLDGGLRDELRARLKAAWSER